jgi:limonene 1,2-monooxygenase
LAPLAPGAAAPLVRVPGFAGFCSALGIGIFGIAQAGTPDDMIAYIERLQQQSGGFGCVMFLAHNCANFEAVKKSYELFARYVIPHFRKSNRGRVESLERAHGNSDRNWGATVGAMRNAIENKGYHAASREGST